MYLCLTAAYMFVLYCLFVCLSVYLIAIVIVWPATPDDSLEGLQILLVSVARWISWSLDVEVLVMLLFSISEVSLAYPKGPFLHK